MMIEHWNKVTDFEEMYEVSNMGNIRSLDRKVRGSFNLYAIKKGQKIKPVLNQSGYATVILCNGPTGSKRKTIHRIVALAFIPNPENKPFINHINGNRTDNRVINLEWCTPAENAMHAWKTGLAKGKYSTEFIQSILNYMELNPKKSVKQCADKFNVSTTMIYNLIKNKLNKNEVSLA